MQPNSDIIISDTSCLILLSKIDELRLLNLVGNQIYVTTTIQKEFGKQLPEWINFRDPKDVHYQKILEMDLDKGEASAIALALELENSMILIDDLKGRKVAHKLNLKYSGTFGLILRAKQMGLLPSIKPVIEKIQTTNFRFSQSVIEFILKEAGE